MSGVTRKADYEKYRVLMEMIHQQQNFYWQRFIGFATIHAGLLVLAAAMIDGHRFLPGLVIAIISLILAVIWLGVQYRSLDYVDEWKRAYHDERRRVGITTSQDHNSNALWSNNKPERDSSTRWAMWAPICVTLIWLAVLFTSFAMVGMRSSS